MQTTYHLTLVPLGGLGNRMRAVASAIQVACETGCRIRIAWRATNDCNARWEDLFQPIDTAALGLSDGQLTIDDGTLADAPASRGNLWLPTLLRKGKYVYQNSCYRPHADEPVGALLNKGNVYIATYYAFADYSNEFLQQIFVPNTLLAQKIAQTIASFTPDTIGIHIRRTDNRQSITESPLTAFHKRMDQALANGEADRLFLCTDDLAVREHLVATYADRILCRRIKLRRDSTEAIQDAVVDLWCLSRTKLILGSYYSSFSDTAAELGRATLEVVRK